MALLQWHDSNNQSHDKLMQPREQPKLAYLQIRICFCTLANSDLKTAALQHRQSMVGRRTESWEDLWHFNQLLQSEELQ